jgi:hypothetical protein
MTGAAAAIAALSMAASEFPEHLAPYVAELNIEVVRDADGRQVPNTKLFVSGGNEAIGRWERYVTTDASGIARVRLPMVGHYQAHAMDQAFARGWMPLRTSPSSPKATIRLRPACFISGRVVAADGKPLGGARIETWAEMERIQIEADRRGAFRIDRIPAGQLVLSAYAEGYTSEDVQVSVRPGDHRRGVAIVLKRGAALTVTALCGGGKCAGARVAIDGAGENDYGELDVDADGAAAFRNLRVGEVKVRAVRGKELPGELASPWVTHRLATGDAAALTLTLAPTGGRGSIRGNVISKSGKPLFAAIEVDCAGVRRQMNTQQDGSFVVRDLPEGRLCKLIASRDGGRADVETDGRAPLRLVVDTPMHP